MSQPAMRTRALRLAVDASVAQVGEGVPTVSGMSANGARVKPERAARAKTATLRDGTISTESGETPMGSNLPLVGEAGRVGHSAASDVRGETGRALDTKNASPASAHVSRFVPSPPPVCLPPEGHVSPSNIAVTTRGKTKDFLS